MKRELNQEHIMKFKPFSQMWENAKKWILTFSRRFPFWELESNYDFLKIWSKVWRTNFFIKMILFLIIEKMMKSKYPKWGCIPHLKIWNIIWITYWMAKIKLTFQFSTTNMFSNRIRLTPLIGMCDMMLEIYFTSLKLCVWKFPNQNPYVRVTWTYKIIQLITWQLIGLLRFSLGSPHHLR